MSTDPKINQIIEILREEKERNETRFSELKASTDNQFSELKASDADLRSMVQTLTDVVYSQGELNDSRWTQLSTELKEVKTELKQEINKVYTSLSEDIQVFGEEQEKLKHRVDKIERRIA